MRIITRFLSPLALALCCLPAAHADICADLRTLQQQSQSHFDGLKKEGNDPAVKGPRGAPVYLSNFMLDGAQSCTISADPEVYSCQWRFASPAELGAAYQRMVNAVKACPPLAKDAPAVIADAPRERARGDLRQVLEVTGFDYADAQITVLLGQMQISGPNGVARNELKLSFSRSGAQ